MSIFWPFYFLLAFRVYFVFEGSKCNVGLIFTFFCDFYSIFNEFLVNIIYYVTKILCLFYRTLDLPPSDWSETNILENPTEKKMVKKWIFGTTLYCWPFFCCQTVEMSVSKKLWKMRLSPLLSNLRDFSSFTIFFWPSLGRGSLLYQKRLGLFFFNDMTRKNSRRKK